LFKYCDGLLGALRYKTRKPHVTTQHNFIYLVEKVSIITTTEELLKTSIPRQRIQKQVSVKTAKYTLFSRQRKGRSHDKKEINCSTRCSLFCTPRATSRGLLKITGDENPGGRIRQKNTEGQRREIQRLVQDPDISERFVIKKESNMSTVVIK
jgi:hypothetical protein